MLQAAACHEVSMACPLSVCDKREQGASKEEESEDEKKYKLDAEQASFQRRQVLRLEGGWWTHIKKPNYFKSRTC